jgi:hypothetical protein
MLIPVTSSTPGVNFDRGTLAKTVSVVDNNGMPRHNMITFTALLTDTTVVAQFGHFVMC